MYKYTVFTGIFLTFELLLFFSSISLAGELKYSSSNVVFEDKDENDSTIINFKTKIDSITIQDKESGCKFIYYFFGKSNGIFTMKWNGGSIDNYAHGNGILKVFINDSESMTYIGTLNKGKTNGYGTKIWVNEQRYTGETKNGLENGFGTIYLGNSDKYVGYWENGQYDGHGTYYFYNGDKYIGEFKDGQPNGSGTFYWQKGDKYVGEFKNGLFNGYGTYFWKDDRKYVGNWKDGKKCGQGIYSWVDGDKYIGEWKNDKQNGLGTLICDTEKYEGEWKDGLKHGKGTLINSNGDILKKGTWSNDIFIE